MKFFTPKETPELEQLKLENEELRKKLKKYIQKKYSMSAKNLENSI